MINRWATCLRLVLAGCGALMLAGCSTGSPFSVARNDSGKPTVWDCAMIQMSSPPKYACSDGKTYTAFQLRDMRQASNEQENSVAMEHHYRP